MIYNIYNVDNPVDMEDISEMMFPVQCKWCRHIHDAAKVKVLHRYYDCSVWRCPNCKVKIDDRHEALGGSAIPVKVTRDG